MMHIHVISNIFNFLAEGTIASIRKRCDVTHLRKSPEYAKKFNSEWVDSVFHDTGRGEHHFVINRVIAREKYNDGDIILFVDHDICFNNWPFNEVYEIFDKWFSEDDELLLAHTLYDYPNPHDRHFKFRTNPLFAVRKDPRMITDDWTPSHDMHGHLQDTGRVLCERLEREGKTRYLEITAPTIHLHCHWLFNNYISTGKQPHVARVMREGGFSPSEEEMQMMRRFNAFDQFLDEWRSRDHFHPL